MHLNSELECCKFKNTTNKIKVLTRIPKDEKTVLVTSKTL